MTIVTRGRATLLAVTATTVALAANYFTRTPNSEPELLSVTPANSPNPLPINLEIPKPPLVIPHEELFLNTFKESLIEAKSSHAPVVAKAINEAFSSLAMTADPTLIEEYLLNTGPVSGKNLTWDRDVIQSWTELGGSLTEDLETFRSSSFTGRVNFFIRTGSSDGPATDVLRWNSTFDCSTRWYGETSSNQAVELTRGDRSLYRFTTEQFIEQTNVTIPADMSRVWVRYLLDDKLNQHEGVQVFQKSKNNNGGTVWLAESSTATRIIDTVQEVRDIGLIHIKDPHDLLNKPFPVDVVTIDPLVESRTNVVAAGMLTFKPGRLTYISFGDLDTCPPCQAKVVYMQELQSEFPGVDFYSVSLSGTLRNFPERFSNVFFARLDPKMMDIIGGGVIPIGVLVNKHGIVVDVLQGAIEDEEKKKAGMKEYIRTLVKTHQ